MQRELLANITEALWTKDLACVMEMPSDPAAMFCIFPDSPSARALGIPALDIADSDALHSILLLPHSLESFPCQQFDHRGEPAESIGSSQERMATFDSGAPKSGWTLGLSSLLGALPDSGTSLLRKTIDMVSAKTRSTLITSSIDTAPVTPVAGGKAVVAGKVAATLDASIDGCNSVSNVSLAVDAASIASPSKANGTERHEVAAPIELTDEDASLCIDTNNSSMEPVEAKVTAGDQWSPPVLMSNLSKCVTSSPPRSPLSASCGLPLASSPCNIPVSPVSSPGPVGELATSQPPPVSPSKKPKDSILVADDL